MVESVARACSHGGLWEKAALALSSQPTTVRTAAIESSALLQCNQKVLLADNGVRSLSALHHAIALASLHSPIAHRMPQAIGVRGKWRLVCVLVFMSLRGKI